LANYRREPEGDRVVTAQAYLGTIGAQSKKERNTYSPIIISTRTKPASFILLLMNNPIAAKLDNILQ
jgi:hypothetical protein